MKRSATVLLAAATLLPWAPAAEAGPRYRSRAYAPRGGGSRCGGPRCGSGGDDGAVFVGGLVVGFLGGLIAASPPPPCRRRVVYVEGPPPASTVVLPSTPAPCVEFAPQPAPAQVWIPAQTIWRESRVVEPAVFGTRRIPAFQDVEVPVFEDRVVPVTREIVEPVFEERCDPATGARTTVRVGERRRTERIGTRTERVQVGTRVERRPLGVREERVLVRAATVRVVRVPETIPGRFVWVGSAPSQADAEVPSEVARPSTPAPPIELGPPVEPAPVVPPPVEPTPSTELELPAPIRPR